MVRHSTWSVFCTLVWLAAGGLSSTLSFAQAPTKKLIHAGYPAEVAYIRQNIGSMKALPFDGTIFSIHELRPIFNYERKWTKKQVQRHFDDLATTDWGRVNENFLLMQVEQASRINWFDDEQWKNVEHNLQLAIEAVVLAKAKGIIFDPEQYNFPLWEYEKAAHSEAKTYDEYFDQVRKRGAQWMRIAQSVKPDIKILHYYLLSFFRPYYSATESSGGDTPERLKKGGGLYLGFITGLLDVAGPEVVFIDGNESSYYYGSRVDYDAAYVQIKQERLYLIPPEHRLKYRQQVQVGAALYMQGTLGMRNYSVQALGAFLQPAGRLRLLEHRTYQALRTTDEYVWCYSDSRGINWWNDTIAPGAAEALASAKRKAAFGLPLGFPEERFEEIKRKQQRIMQHGRTTIVPRRAVVEKVGADGPPVIDGKLDDPVWKRVKQLERFRVPNIYIKENLQAPTTAQVAWDDEHLYVAFICQEPKVAEISRRAKEHDGGVWNDDCVEVFISAGVETFPYRHFEVNSIDTHFDATWTERKKMDPTWSAEWKSRSMVHGNGWTSEIAIPWTVIGTRPREGESRRANVTRHRIPHEEETTTWTPMYKTFSDPEYLGTWIFQAAAR